MMRDGSLEEYGGILQKIAKLSALCRPAAICGTKALKPSFPRLRIPQPGKVEKLLEAKWMEVLILTFGIK